MDFIINIILISIPIGYIVYKVYNKLITEGKFPFYSGISLIYPLSAMIFMYIKEGSLVLSYFYELANLGYLLLASGIIKGTFLVLDLKNRVQVFIFAAVCFALSFLFFNF